MERLQGLAQISLRRERAADVPVGAGKVALTFGVVRSAFREAPGDSEFLPVRLQRFAQPSLREQYGADLCVQECGPVHAAEALGFGEITPERLQRRLQLA